MTGDLLLDADSAIAVIGMAGRFPGAAGVDEFWANLCSGAESITRLPDQPGGDPEYVPSFGVLDGADEFDAGFFGYAPGEALVIDPQQRLFLECAHEALERAGYGAAAGRGSVGVFAGGSTTDYRAVIESQLHRLPFVDSWQVRLGTAPDFLATRVAHKLGLRGPAVSVQTACSTSLVAVHLAMQALLAGDCQLALAGGASVHAPYPRVDYTEGGIIARDGHCRAFDAEATGTVGGNAVAVVVLKPLTDALADDDHVHAVLRGSAVNNDGGDAVGFTAPSVDGQAEVIRAAQVVAGVDADTITYVETHGTGTRLGDPIEVAALTKAFGRTGGRGQCAIGSVKTNIGHTDAAAGVTGLIKAVLAVEHGLIPPSLHFTRPNPEIDFAGSPFVVNATLREWRPPGMPRRAGVSSLGVGGTNAHVVVEQPPPLPAPGPARGQQLLVLSAKTTEALGEAGRRLAEHLRESPGTNLADVAWTLQAGRQAHRFRRFVVGADPQACATSLGTATAGPTTGHGDAAAAPAPAVTFMFPGQGGQHVGMARQLYDAEPVFREVFDECALIARPALGVDLRSVLFPPAGDEHAAAAAKEHLDTIAVGQPAVFAVEYALARLLLSWGMRPAAVVGHSLGAFAAACVAGVFSLPDAVRLVVRRGQLLQSLPAGAMVAVRLSEARTVPLLPDGLSVAAVNGPDQCTVSGPIDRAEAFAGELAARDVEARVLPIATAGHSALVEPIVDEFRAAVDAMEPRPAGIPFVSDTTGTWAAPDQLATGRYWATHLRAPVQFGTALSTLFAGGPRRVLVEVGPGGTLVTLARRHPERGQHIAVPTLPHPLDETGDLATLLGAIGNLWTAGVPIDWRSVRGEQQRRRVVLPGYPFQRKRYLVQAPEPASRPPEGMTGTGNGSAADPGPPMLLGEPGHAAADRPPDSAATDRPAGTEPGTEPMSELESTLAAAFAQALGFDRIGPADDLFQLGADSLTATRLAAWAGRQFSVALKAADIIRARTVAAVAGLIEQQLGTETREIRAAAAPVAPAASAAAPATTDGSGSSWLSCRRRVAAPAVRLYCLPQSGGAAGEYLRFADAMPEVEVWGLNLPGRGPRLDEPPLGSMAELAVAMVDDVEFVAPFVLFGHSFGALLAYHVAQELRARGREQPDHLLLSGYPPPHVPRVAPVVSDLPDEEFLARLGEFYGGVPAELGRDPELAALVLPAYRADVAILERYADAGHEPLDRPLVVVGGDGDAFSEEQLAEWSRHTTADCRVHMVPGGHFYFRERPELLIGLVRGCALTR